jgi:hypothetical protein
LVLLYIWLRTRICFIILPPVEMYYLLPIEFLEQVSLSVFGIVFNLAYVIKREFVLYPIYYTSSFTSHFNTSLLHIFYTSFSSINNTYLSLYWPLLSMPLRFYLFSFNNFDRYFNGSFFTHTLWKCPWEFPLVFLMLLRIFFGMVPSIFKGGYRISYYFPYLITYWHRYFLYSYVFFRFFYLLNITLIFSLTSIRI